MSRKHFIEIARVINEQREEIADNQYGYKTPDEVNAELLVLRSTAIRLAAAFGGFNEQFDYQRFLTACGF